MVRKKIFTLALVPDALKMKYIVKLSKNLRIISNNQLQKEIMIRES